MSNHPSSSSKKPSSPRPPSVSSFSPGTPPRVGPGASQIAQSPIVESPSSGHRMPINTRQSEVSTVTQSSAIPDSGGDADLPMTMTASVVLTALPGDAREALERTAIKTEGGIGGKVTVHFHALRDAPAMKQTRFKIKSNQPFGAVISFLRKKLKLKDSDGIWCYVGNFAPAPDEGVGGLWNCFKTGEELSVSYSTTPTFG